MPFTPFHFGPGAALNVAAPRHVSFLAFCAANIIIDIEPLYYMLTNQYPLHRFLHTYVGASVGGLATIALFALAKQAAAFLPNIFYWKRLTLRPVVIGAALGTYSHVALDSLMHADIRPFAPFSDANPMLGLVSLSVLHGACVIAGLLALAVLGIRRMGPW